MSSRLCVRGVAAAAAPAASYIRQNCTTAVSATIPRTHSPLQLLLSPLSSFSRIQTRQQQKHKLPVHLLSPVLSSFYSTSSCIQLQRPQLLYQQRRTLLRSIPMLRILATTQSTTTTATAVDIIHPRSYSSRSRGNGNKNYYNNNNNGNNKNYRKLPYSPYDDDDDDDDNDSKTRGRTATTDHRTSRWAEVRLRRRSPKYASSNLPPQARFKGKVAKKKIGWLGKGVHNNYGQSIPLGGVDGRGSRGDDDEEEDEIEDEDEENEEKIFGPMAASVMRDIRRRRRDNLTLDEEYEQGLRMADYFNAPDGSMEDLVGERQVMARAGLDDLQSREKFKAEVDDLIKEGRILGMDLEEDEDNSKHKIEPEIPFPDPYGEEYKDPDNRDPSVDIYPGQNAYGEWSEMLVTVDRGIKLWKGGRIESYRALVVGGNMNGCAGFAWGKSNDPLNAISNAAALTRRNIFFVERYQGTGLVRDLVGTHNSCKVTLRVTHKGLLRGNELVTEILKRFGIVNVVAKTHGNRNPPNIVYATFRALLTHETIEEIALKRGKRLVSLDRALRMQI